MKIPKPTPTQFGKQERGHEDATLSNKTPSHHPNENKDHIANCFEDLYQAREGTEEYKEWTEQITNPVKIALRNPTATPTPTPRSQEEMISDKEMQNSIKKLKRKKTPAPEKLPNEIFIEADTETRKVLKTMIEKAHKNETIPDAWAEGEIIRLYKGKGQKRKCYSERGITLASNAGKVYERIIKERVKQQIQLTKAEAGGKSGCATVDHRIVLKQTIQEIQEKGHNLPGSVVQKAYDKAWLDAIVYAIQKNGVESRTKIWEW